MKNGGLNEKITLSLIKFLFYTQKLVDLTHENDHKFSGIGIIN